MELVHFAMFLAQVAQMVLVNAVLGTIFKIIVAILAVQDAERAHQIVHVVLALVLMYCRLLPIVVLQGVQLVMQANA